MADHVNEKVKKDNTTEPGRGTTTTTTGMRDERTVRQKLADWYLVYELRTALYSLEPWEKAMFSECLMHTSSVLTFPFLIFPCVCMWMHADSFLVAFLSMGCYTAYCFLPRYASSFIKYFNLM